jgi:hypothetical protein
VGFESSVRDGRILAPEQICWRRQPFTRAIDQKRGAQFSLQLARSLVIRGLERVEEDLHEGVWPVDLQIVIRVRDEVQAVAAGLKSA